MTPTRPSVTEADLSPGPEHRQLRALAQQAGLELDGHGNRVAGMAQALGHAHRGEPPPVHLALGAQLHDIGKRHIPDTILDAPRRLTPAEWAVMRLHTILGLEILCRALGHVPQDVADCVLLHHEHWDGSGYPIGLSGASIPLLARLVAIADFIDALASPRAYKSAMAPELVRTLVLRARGVKFDPILTDLALRIWPQLLRARAQADQPNGVTTKPAILKP
ncbi:HD domain-containing protein [Acetobacter suratthaniensis]|uniref:HD domain-containing protein n=1 Tax=Acetobacter suratthaniensis TaxID=1502841 RepID=A0ABS3LQ03_9PROT|nr:HD domain-containing phosphohydrolase [Acetobacter suratthaniensis]MBO1329458.1 HD domain-containing protein [Acetobacter suratthaniensis]MCX2567481.1 HD domain-containing protein [Acetobacter suratthaniensis]